MQGEILHFTTAGEDDRIDSAVVTTEAANSVRFGERIVIAGRLCEVTGKQERLDEPTLMTLLLFDTGEEVA